ncbi:exodeoxyribonuclease V, gamma subunit [Propionibacterium sp. oral taxon 192 str. F0372]|uniref:exodeoxyribonuclease V subunit gamma n=1 Tax=Propionibacterium sp. oral taxon 192 TaxID=671222 RepID=UPI000352F61F|nr:exodeoxyribonuclease V subunit gamma [Propionibacterium sp. oral taxon 192]EPH00346.1 exodeoxyribonuclease V, gamma subunit [Propionibacterium sp. oral taxon 192 str. F0372]
MRATTRTTCVAVRACSSWYSLTTGVAELLHSNPPPVFESDLVIVPSGAHQRHLTQFLAAATNGPGICTGVDFCVWAGLRARLLDACGLSEPWAGKGLDVAILEAITSSDDKTTEILRRHLGHNRPGRAGQLGHRIARLFNDYIRHAPAMVAAWSRGEETGPKNTALDSRDLWQPTLWRQLVATSGTDLVQLNNHLLTMVYEGLATGIPARVVAVAIDDPLPSDLELLDALAAHHEVHLFVHRPIMHGSGSHLVNQLNHRTLSSDPLATPFPESSGTWLNRVQSAIRANTTPLQITHDTTIQIHACHGPNRQVEVLREILCTLFSDDPSLQPRDVVVLCPDPVTFAPLVAACFQLDSDSGAMHPAARLRVQLSAGSLSRFNPVLGLLITLFSLLDGRATADELLALCQSAPVAKAFGFGAEELDSLSHLIADAQIRWGVDPAHRHRNGVEVLSSTWLAGVERMLVSIALDPLPPVSLRTVTPLTHFDEPDTALVGRLAELVSRIRKILGGFAIPATAPVWADRLGEAIDLLAATDFDDRWQVQEVLNHLADLRHQTQNSSAILTARDVVGWCEQWQESGRGRPNHANGSLLVTSLDDLACVEHRVVCVLGLEDTTFPGSDPVDGDDLLARGADHRHWTKVTRSRHQQRLLDALLAAQDRFIIITQGADELTGRRLPMPVCLAELLDAISPAVSIRSWEPAADEFVRWHPLHSHNCNNFLIDSPFSHDLQALDGAKALQLPAVADEPRWRLLHCRATEESTSRQVTLDELITFFIDPARELLRTACGTTWSGFDDSLPENLPIALDQRQAWSVGEEIFRMVLQGADPACAAQVAWLSGRVLPGPLGQQVVSEQLEVATRVAATVRAGLGELTMIDCSLDLGQVVLTGSVPVHGGRVVVSRFGHLKPDDALRAWLKLCLVNACHGVQTIDGALLLGKRSKSLRCPDPDQATTILRGLVRLRAEGLTRVLPLPLRTAAAYCNVLTFERGQHSDRARAAFAKENENWAYFFSTYSELVASRPVPHDPAPPGGALGSRFETLAAWLFVPININLREWRP